MSDRRADIVAAVPSFRAFAFPLARHTEDADDLVHATLVRAFRRLSSFEEGTNLHPWLLTILQNAFYSTYRKHVRVVENPDGAYAARLCCHGEQEGHLQCEEVLRAFAKLNPKQREALTLFVASGLSFEEAAAITNVAVGTAKSRVIRASAQTPTNAPRAQPLTRCNKFRNRVGCVRFVGALALGPASIRLWPSRSPMSGRGSASLPPSKPECRIRP